MNLAEEIKSRVTTKQLFIHYGFEPNRAGFIVCPFHSEKTPSLKIYENNRGWNCFGCGMGGDIIAFVQKYFNLSFKDAISKINDDFCLGLPINEHLSKRKRLEIARQSYQRKKTLNAKKERENALKQNYYDALDLFVRLDNQKRLYKPKSPNEDLHPLFVDALQNYEYAKHCLNHAEMELYKFNEQTRDNCNS